MPVNLLDYYSNDNTHRYKAKKIVKHINNAVYLDYLSSIKQELDDSPNDVDDADLKCYRQFDYDEVLKCLDLRLKYSTKKEVYTEMKFKSLMPFNHWLEKRYIEY